MRRLLAILGIARRSLRQGLSARLALVVGVAALSGATAGVLPAVIGIALSSIVGRAGPPPPGIAGFFARLLAGAPIWVVLVATLAATLATVFVSVLSSKLGSQLAGELTAAVRIEMLRGALFASPRDVEELGRAMTQAKAANAPPGMAAKAPLVRGGEIVKLTIARESALAAEFLVAVMTGLPQAFVTLAVLAYELVMGGTWLVLAGGASLFVISRVLSDGASRRVARAMREMQKFDADIFANLGEKLAATEDLRLLGARGQALAEFANAAYACADARTRFTGALAVSGQIKSVFTAMSPLIILIALVASGRAHDAGDVAKLLLYVPLLMARFEALDALRSGLIEREPVLAATLKLFELPEAPARSSDPASADAIASGAIEIENLSFTPPGADKPVLDGLSLSIPAGSIVGICGPSGCGKSTLVRLLLRLDEADAGSITLGGIDVRRLDAAQLARAFGVLGQASRLLERTVAANLALGLTEPPTADRMRATLRQVKLDELAGGAAGARSLETEYRAVPPNFSGGEQRRLLLSRMLVRDAKIFVLDEPEAGLPSATAEEILRAVAEVAKGRTCLVVTHAPHLLASSFNVVIDRGKVAAIGAHDELVRSSELYRALLAEGLRGPQKPAPPSIQDRPPV
jgi:ATP-binding cassette subfamily B protein